MSTVKGMFDGQSIKLLGPPPSTRPASVMVTFLEDEESPATTLKETAAGYEVSVERSKALADVIDKARVVIGADGQPVAMQMDIADWSALMNWLEDVEDTQLMRERFRERSERAVTAWEDFEAELKADGLL